MLLGMPKRDISRILVYETMAVGFLSLLSGLLLGALCSQLLGIFSAGMLQVSMSFRVIFSIPSAITTSISFTVIFVIIMLLNTRVIAKVKLIDLLQSKKKMEKARIRRPWMSVLVLLISLTLLATAYYLATSSLQTFAVMLVPILVIGGIGTILFFMSLSGFLLQFIRLSKRTYYRNLHMVVLRQINAKISSASTSMGIVCLMLLLAIGALSCGFSLHHSLVDSVDQTTPYMYTYMQDENISEEAMKQLLNVQKAKRWNRVNVYTDRDTLKAILPLMEDYDTGKLYAGAPLEYISVSDYNKAMESQGNKPVSIHNKEAFFISAKEDILDALTAVGDAHKTISVYGHKLKLVTPGKPPAFSAPVPCRKSCWQSLYRMRLYNPKHPSGPTGISILPGRRRFPHIKRGLKKISRIMPGRQECRITGIPESHGMRSGKTLSAPVCSLFTSACIWALYSLSPVQLFWHFSS